MFGMLDFVIIVVLVVPVIWACVSIIRHLHRQTELLVRLARAADRDRDEG